MELCPIHGPTPPHHPVVMDDHDLVWKHTKTRCRAFEGALAVVTFQTFYRGDHKTLKNETLASGANFIIIITTIIIIIIYISITIHLTPALRSGSA